MCGNLNCKILLEVAFHHDPTGGDTWSLALDHYGHGPHHRIGRIFEMLGVEAADAFVSELVAPEFHGEGPTHTGSLTVIVNQLGLGLDRLIMINCQFLGGHFGSTII